MLGLMFICGVLSAQEKKGDMLFKAMQDELVRNMKDLSLPGLERPFFIEYAITEGRQIVMNATLGSVNFVSELPFTRGIYTRVLVGSRHQTNEMSYDNRRLSVSGLNSRITTIDDNYGQIRRDLWRQTDNAYKIAAEEYVRKVAALKQKNLSQDDASLDDLDKAASVNKIIPSNNIRIDKANLTHLIEGVSALFKDYPDIEISEVMSKVTSNDVYVVNSENSKYSFPNNMVTFEVSAGVRGDGKVTTDKLIINVLQEKDLPSLDELKAQCKAFIDRMIILKNAPSIKDSYSGPVLFEGNAVATLFDNELFSTSGAYAIREPVRGVSVNTFQDKMDSKVISSEFTVKCLPFLTEYNGTKLIGHFDMDLEGIVPEKELILIENGMLKKVIGSRIPTKYNSAPNGYFRSGSQPFIYQGILCPGVVDISTSHGVSNDSLKRLLLKGANENGFKYAYIVRKLTTLSGLTGGYSPIYLYRVNATDGSEELVRDAEFRDLRKGLLKLALGSSNTKTVVNTSISNAIPVSYICPDAVIIPDIEIALKKEIQKMTMPVVLNPLKDKS